jgi:serine/threonine-protein kinase HipA
MFNIAVGNTDDHARNHAAFVLGAGHELKLTPAYDISPQPRSGQTARHPQFGATGNDRVSRIAALVEAAPIYHLDAEEAQSIADRYVDTIRSEWDEVCDLARLTLSQRRTLMGGPILNDYILRDVLTRPAVQERLGSRIHQRFATIGGAELDLPARTDLPRSATLP